MALTDREAIMRFIAQDNVNAAIELDMQFEEKAEIARQRPTLY
jgi:plasmid stabilization system protein ParE